MATAQKPYSMLGTPEAGSTARIVPLNELARMLNNSPFLRDAVQRINNFEGSPRLAEQVIHEDYRKHVDTVKNNAFQIKAGILKQQGVLG